MQTHVSMDKSITILVLDSETAQNRPLVSHLLAVENWKVDFHLIPDVDEAIRAASNSDPDAIFINTLSFKESADSIVRQFRKWNSRTKLVVVCDEEEGDCAISLMAGADYFIGKNQLSQPILNEIIHKIGGSKTAQTAQTADVYKSADQIYHKNLEIQNLNDRIQAIEIKYHFEKAQRLAAQKTIDEIEDKYRKTLLSIAEYTYTVRFANGEPISAYHSPQCENITGYTPEEYYTIPDLWYLMIYEQDRETVLRYLEDIRSLVQRPPLEHRIVHKSGSIRWVVNNCRVTLDKTGAIIRQDGTLLDITDRKLAEEKVQESEEKYRSLVENASDIVFTMDLHGNVTSINRRAEVVHGYSTEEYLTKNIRDLIPPEFLEATHEKIGILAEGGQVESLELPVISKNGEIKIMEVTAEPILKDEKVVGVQGISRDVTQRRKVEDALRLSEEKYRQIVDSALEGIWKLDADGKTIFANRRLAQILGCGSKEIYRYSFCDFLDPAMQNGLEEFLRNHSPGTVTPAEILMRKKDGAELWALLNANASYGDDGKLAGALIMLTDVTQRKREEAKKLFWASIAKSSDDAIIGMSLDGMIKSWNKGAEKIFGYAQDAAIGSSAEIIVSPCRKEEFSAILRSVAEGEHINGFQTIRKRKNGELIDVSITMSPIMDEKGTILGASEIIRDMTNRKLAEDELRKAKDHAEEATRLKDKFISLVAHDLRAPFNSILGLMNILQNQGVGTLNEKQSDIVSRVISSGENLLKMVDELLNINRLQTGRITVRPRFFDASIMANSAIQKVEHLARHKGVEIRNEIPNFTRVYADYDLYGEVALNLISNAIKFCNPGDSITIYQPDSRKGVIAVADTGVGIKPHLVSDLFRYDVPTSTRGTAGEKGTGLGLPLCHEIMQSHGGSLKVESVEHMGTVFYASVPDVKPNVLLVDDDESDRFLYKEFMEDLDVIVHDAGNGAEAINIISDNEIHLIITDINMPIMDGLSMTKRLRFDSKTERTPIIVLTASVSIEKREEVLRAGATDFVTKPVKKNELIPRMRRFIS